MKETALGVIAFLAGGAVAGALWLTATAAVEVHRALRAERAKHRARLRRKAARPGRNYTQAWPKRREGSE